MPLDKVKTYQCVQDPFFMESIEPGTKTEELEYHGRGEDVYADGRQVLVRSCHDALVSYPNEEGEKGILLIRREAEPVNGYLWPLGGFFDRGVSSIKSLASRIKHESGLDIDEDSLIILGQARMMWNTTPHKEAKEKGLPLGIDDMGLLYYGEGCGNLNMDKLQDVTAIVTPKIYTTDFRESLHPYVQLGMDRAIELIR